MIQTITIKQLQDRAAELLVGLRPPDEIIVATDTGKPLAKISAAAPQNGLAKPREFGFWKGQIDTTPDFDAPLPDSFWLGEQ